MATYTGDEISRFFRRDLGGKVSYAEKVAAKTLLGPILERTFDHRKGCKVGEINTTDNDCEADVGVIIRVADRLAEAASAVAKDTRRLNGHTDEE
jgi:hypothetical protein